MKQKHLFIPVFLILILYACNSSSINDSIDAEKESIEQKVDSMEAVVIVQFSELESLLDSSFANNETYSENWQNQETQEKPSQIIEKFINPFDSHCDMVRTIMDGNKASISSFISNFRAFYYNYKDDLDTNKTHLDLVTIKIPSILDNIEKQYTKMRELGAMYEVLCRVEKGE